MQDVTTGSPAERAGLHPYDVILDVEGRDVGTNEELIRDIAARQPGTVARLGVMRDARRMMLRSSSPNGRRAAGDSRRFARPLGQPAAGPEPAPESPLGLNGARTGPRVCEPPRGPRVRAGGDRVSRVDPTGAAFSASIRRGFVIMEINRKPIHSVADYQRLVSVAHAGDVLALYYYDPTLAQRALVTVTVE